MVGFVPPDVLRAGVDRKHHVGTNAPDNPGDLFHQIARIGIFQHPVVILEPLDVLFGDADDPAGFLFFVHADPRQVFAGHFRVVGAFVVIGVNHDPDVVSVLRQQRQSARAAEGIVIRMGSEQENCLTVQIFQTALRLRRQDRRKANEKYQDSGHGN